MQEPRMSKEGVTPEKSSYKVIDKEKWMEGAHLRVERFLLSTPVYLYYGPDKDHLDSRLEKMKYADIDAYCFAIGKFAGKYLGAFCTGEFVEGHYVNFADEVYNGLTDDLYEQISKVNNVDLSAINDPIADEFFDDEYIGDIVLDWVQEVVDRFDIKVIASLLKRNDRIKK